MPIPTPINLNLELWEINLILSALSKQPYEEVAATIQRIKQQVEES